MTSKVNVSLSVDKIGLQNLQKALASAGYVKVGILGENASRDDEMINNAELGMVQEFGSAENNIPPRSFLRMPLETQKEKISAVMQTKTFAAAIEAGKTEKALELIGVAAEGVIDDAFTSRGFGTWPANKAATVARKGSSKPLIDTSQLRRAISSEVASGKKD